MEEKLEQTRAELEKYGKGPPTDEAERLVFLMDVGGLMQHQVSLVFSLDLTIGKCFPAASDDVQSGCHQSGCWGGAQVWRQTQHLYHPEKRVLEVA